MSSFEAVKFSAPVPMGLHPPPCSLGAQKHPVHPKKRHFFKKKRQIHWVHSPGALSKPDVRAPTFCGPHVRETRCTEFCQAPTRPTFRCGRAAERLAFAAAALFFFLNYCCRLGRMEAVFSSNARKICDGILLI